MKPQDHSALACIELLGTTMQIDLNKAEIELLDKALETWEKDAHSGALMGSLMSAMLCPKEERVGEETRRALEMKKAAEETQSRRFKSVLLRAKLYQALARESEYTTDAHA